MVCGEIKSLGLVMIPQKTVFLRGRKTFLANAAVVVRDTSIPLVSNIKYLGLTINKHWSFNDHFGKLIPKVDGTALALSRLMPNLRGPG